MTLLYQIGIIKSGYNEMVKKEKLINRLKSRPKDFTFKEAETLLGYFGYVLNNKGKTSGSSVIFIHPQRPPILLHKPHKPHQNVLLEYQIQKLIKGLENEGLI